MYQRPARSHLLSTSANYSNKSAATERKWPFKLPSLTHNEKLSYN